MNEPESRMTTSLPPVTTPVPGAGLGPLIWIPYLILTLALVILACASFIQYHFKNREKYIEAMYKRKNNIHSSPKKYRVTLNRKGIVGCVNVGHTYDTNRVSIAESDTPSSTMQDHSAMKHDIFIVNNQRENEASKKYVTANGRIPRAGDAPRTRSQSYDNEAYDHDSSQGSEKSLIHKSSDSSGKTDSYIELEREPFSVKDIDTTAQARNKENPYVIGGENARSNYSISRPQSRTETPTGLVFRSETPLNLPDNSDLAKKRSVHRAGSRPTMGKRQTTVAPLEEEPDNEDMFGEDSFSEEDINVK